MCATSCHCQERSERSRLSVRGAWAGGPVAGLSEETLKRLDGEGKLGLRRRRILGLPDEGTGED